MPYYLDITACITEIAVNETSHWQEVEVERVVVDIVEGDVMSRDATPPNVKPTNGDASFHPSLLTLLKKEQNLAGILDIISCFLSCTSVT